MDTPLEKRPRQYSQEILALTSLMERREALEKVPPHLRPMVENHIKIAWERKPKA